MKKLFLALLAVFSIALVVAGCGGDSKPAANSGDKKVVLKVGATPVPHAEILNLIKPQLAKEGVDLQIIEFSDYVKPNLSLADKELDANFFQHTPYLEKFASERNLPLVVGPDYNKKIEATIIKPADIKKLIAQNKQDFVVVDVRDPSEFKEGHIPGAINIPSETFAAGSGVLSKERKIIVYCNTGSRSYLAYKKLIQLAYPDIRQALLASWKEAGLAVEK